MRSKTVKLLMILLSITAILSFSGCGKSDGKNGERSLDSLLVTVPDDISPVAIAGEDQTIVQGDTVTLDGSESFDEDGQIVSYRWELRDGTYLGEGVTLSTDLSLPVGTYEIVLIVTDDKGATGVDTVVITVVAPPPNPPAPDPDPDPKPDPEPAPAPNPPAPAPNPPAPNPPAPDPDPDPKPPVPDNRPPVANAGANQSDVAIGATVTLDGSASTDPDGDTLTYKWTMISRPAGSTAALSSTTAPKPTFTADEYGSYTIELVVNDGKLDSPVDSVTVTTVDEPPSCEPNHAVKKTGQTISYADFDDGYYQMGVTPDYTRDDTNEIVKDNVTCLEWQDDEEAKTVTRDWEGAKTYCASLSLAGRGWRLPTVVELQGIVVDGAYNPSIDTSAFLNYTSNFYWSSTTFVANTSFAWIVDFYIGYTNRNNKTNSYNARVRCVRAGQ